VPDDVYRRSREPDPLWQADLERLAPRSDRINWLKIHWFAGEPYAPVQRWEIREMIPRLDMIPDGFLEALRGPHPRTLGHYQPDDDIPAPGRWISDSIVSTEQWDLFQQTNCFSQRCWIIQGDHGGHVWHLSDTEKDFLEQEGIEGDVPNPGDLPYADYDRRVFAKLAEMDKLQTFDDAIGWDERQENKTQAGLYVLRDKHAMEIEFRKRLMKWLDTQIEAAIDDMPRGRLPGPSDIPAYARAETPDDPEQIERDFIENTSL
jgi:hypothetical protein